MTGKPTQTGRVVAAARSYRGVNQVDFLGPDTVDGGPPITRLAARLWDAEQQGHVFECIGWRQKCKTWRLVSEPDVDRDGGVRQAPEGPTAATVSMSRGVEGGSGVRGKNTRKSDPACPVPGPAAALSPEQPPLFDVDEPASGHYDDARAA